MSKKQKNYKNSKDQILIFNSFSIKQFISLIIGILFALTGLGLIITYLIGDNLAGVDKFVSYYKDYSAALTSFNEMTHTTIGFIGWGIISLLFGVVVIAFALSLSTKTEEKAKESEARKEARRRALLENKVETKPDVIEASEE